MTVLITLTTAGTDSGPFDLYSDIDGYTSAFESGVSKASLLAGYASALVPDYTNIIRVKSNGNCVNYIDIPLPGYTTTTTTTTVIACLEYTVSTTSASNQNYEYYDCFGVLNSGSVGGVGGYDANTFCAQEDSVVLIGIDSTLTLNGPCVT